MSLYVLGGLSLSLCSSSRCVSMEIQCVLPDGEVVTALSDSQLYFDFEVIFEKYKLEVSEATCVVTEDGGKWLCDGEVRRVSHEELDGCTRVVIHTPYQNSCGFWVCFSTFFYVLSIVYPIFSPISF